MQFKTQALLATWLLALAGASHAGQVGTLTIAQPRGVIGSTDDIPVVVRIALPADAQPIIAERLAPSYKLVWSSPALPATGGINPLAPQDRPFASHDFIGYSMGLQGFCNNTVNDPCGGPTAPYSFEMGKFPNTNLDEHLELLPGQPLEFTLGTFHPKGGAAPAGDYLWQGFDAYLLVGGFDTSGFLIQATMAEFHSVCTSPSDACGFGRQVGAVPEPGPWALMGLGLAALAARTRRAKR